VSERLVVDTKPLPWCEGSGEPTRGVFGSLFCSFCGQPQHRSHVARKHKRHPNLEVVADNLVQALERTTP
jgi:hypothetical protein